MRSMHEYAITKEILRISRETAEKNGLAYIKEIVLELGKLTTYEKEPIIHYFNELKIGGNYLKNANLIVNEKMNNEIKIVSVKGEKNGG